MKSLENINPDVVVIDTKSRTFGLDENDNSDNAAYISFFETYLPKHPETTFMIIHHSSKERAGDGGQSSARGGSALIDNARGNLVFTHMAEAEAQKHGVNHLDYFIMSNAKNNYSRRADRHIFTRAEGGVPVLVDLETESRSAALDRLLGILVEDFPGGIPRRELLEKDGGKIIRDILAEEYSMRKPDFKRLVEFGVESTRLIECEDAGSSSRNKPILIRARTVTAPKSGPRQLDFDNHDSF
jgi:replicative DNA helicase